MDRHEAARALGLADADVLAVEETEDGTKVTTRDGGDRLITDDGVFALSDHPATAQLRRHGAEDGKRLITGQPGYRRDPHATHELSADEPEEVPDGSADVVLTWVGDDPERAQRALTAEDRRDHPRTTLVDKLRKLAG